jgi:leucyl aminopeptidase
MICFIVIFSPDDQVSGLDKHMSSSDHPIKYSHLDVAGSSGELPNPTTASSVVALAMHFL